MQAFEQPWSDPFDGTICGLYRRYADDELQGPDHLVVYMRRPEGAPPAEFRGPTTVCGRPYGAKEPPPDVRGTICSFCMDGVGQAFLAGFATLSASPE